MCKRARLSSEPETLHPKFDAIWSTAVPNRWLMQLTPKSQAPVIRSADSQRIIDMMAWDVLGGQVPWPTTNVRNLKLTQWRKLAEDPAQRVGLGRPCS
jgi:putative SOS response-associated peptidase YedK